MRPFINLFSPFLLSLSLSTLALAPSAFAQSLKVTGHTQAGNQITLTVKESGSGTAYRLESSPSLVVPLWSPVAATFAAVPGQTGFFRTTITPPTTDKLFYRVVGMAGTADDTDGDGISNVIELSLGTLPNTYDTDGDGFNDGVEFAFGTTATVGGQSSFPTQQNLPAITFSTSVSAVSEGTATAVVNLQADRPFTGTVRYAVKTRSTAKSPADFSIAGSTTAPTATPQLDDRVGTIPFSGTAATLTLQIADNLTISPARLLILELDPSNAIPANYRTGGRLTHVINLTDNDAYWTGELKDADAKRNFRLKILQNASGRQATFVSGSADGLPMADSGASSQSTGVVPAKTAAGATQEEWSANNLASPDGSPPGSYSFRSPAFPSATAGFIGQGVLLTSTLTFDSTPILRADLIQGAFTEVIAPVTATQSWLARTRSGTFNLYRDLPGPPALTSPLAP